jgi:hypothetical protein
MINYSGNNLAMKAVGIIAIILIAVFVIVMLMTFVFHIIVFSRMLIIPNSTKADLDKSGFIGATLQQAWIV